MSIAKGCCFIKYEVIQYFTITFTIKLIYYIYNVCNIYILYISNISISIPISIYLTIIYIYIHIQYIHIMYKVQLQRVFKWFSENQMKGSTQLSHVNEQIKLPKFM